MPRIRKVSTRTTPKSSKFRGVSYVPSRDDWMVQVNHGGKRVVSTMRKTENEAVELYKLVKQALSDPSFIHEELRKLSYFRERFDGQVS